MGFFLIVLAGVIDIFANLALVRADGFARGKRWWGALALVGVDLTFVCLYFALQTGMALPVAYSLWGAIGILGTTLGGYVLFRQRLKPIGVFGICLVVCAVYLLHFA